MILDYLDTVRTWPIPKRKRFALTLSIGITGIIVLVWLSVLVMGPQQQGTPSTDQPANPVKVEQEDIGMWDRLRASLGLTPETEDATQSPEPSAQKSIPPEALGEFRNTFDESATSASVATSTDTTPVKSTTEPSTPSQPETPTPEDNQGMVESILEEVDR